MTRALGPAGRVARLARVVRRGVEGGYGEQRDGRNAQFDAAPGGFDQQVDAQAFDPGHGGHFFGLPLAFQHEHGPDEVIGGQCMLTHHSA